MHFTSSILFIFATIPLHIHALPVSSSILCQEVLRSDSVDSLYGWNFAKCELHSYGSPDVVECFDNYAKHLNSSADRPLYFAFVGDSRIRQAFHSFWPMLPNYDRKPNELVDRKTKSHFGITIDNVLLNTRVAFLCRPKIDSTVMEELNDWATGVSDVPAFVITGFSSHHMAQNNPQSYKMFQEKLDALVPIFKSLTTKTTVFWLHQNPIIETYGNKNNGSAINRSISNKKYDDYNAMARKILRETGVYFWESSFPMAEEYVRSCVINDRTDKSNLRACYDFLHTGYVIVDRANQVILNAMCNRLLFNSSNPSVIMKPNTCCNQSIS